MKKSIKRFIILSIFLSIISVLVITFMGNTYEVRFHKRSDYSTYRLSNDKKVKIIEEKDDSDLFILKLKSQQPGVVYVEYSDSDFYEIIKLYVHKNMVITNNSFFGYARGSEIIPISIFILLMYSLFLLVKRYKNSINENIYQYKNVAYLGIIIFVFFFVLNNLLSLVHYQGLFDTINSTINSIRCISLFLFPVFFITFILVTISNIKLIRREGKNLRNLLGLFLGIFVCILTLLPDWLYSFLMKTQMFDIYNLSSFGPYLYNFLEVVIYLTVVYLECVLLATIIIAFQSIRSKVIYDKDYIIILGCMIKKDGSLTPLLQGRVDKALEFRNEQLKNTGRDLIFIPSGGKGSNEVISEAEAMKNYLMSHGIKKENILVENQSKNTYENIKFSNQLIKKKNANVVFSTTNYHLFRAG